jgi:chromosome segregation ATPase
LREKIEFVDKTRTEEIVKLQCELDNSLRKGSDSVESFKEQIRQHSVTICAMEERLNKVVKKNKDYQAEVTALKQTITGNNYVNWKMMMMY